jgi:hypothetical protein
MSAPFPQVLVINLDDRTDRWASIKKSCDACQIEPIRISATKAAIGWHGCGLSHLRCIRSAKENREPWILIIEDDATFTPETFARFRELLDYLWNDRATWQRFNGGPTLPANPVVTLMRRQPPLLFARGFCTHFQLIHADAYDAILRWEPERDRQIDVFLMNLETCSTFRSIATYPHIAVQSGNKSDATPGIEDQFPLMFRFSETKLRECLEH